jgi:hypothetical protein
MYVPVGSPQIPGMMFRDKISKTRGLPYRYRTIRRDLKFLKKFPLPPLLFSGENGI